MDNFDNDVAEERFTDEELLGLIYEPSHPQYELAINDLLQQCWVKGEDYLENKDSRYKGRAKKYLNKKDSSYGGRAEISEFLMLEVGRVEAKLREGNTWLKTFTTDFNSNLALFALRASGGYLIEDFRSYLKKLPIFCEIPKDHDDDEDQNLEFPDQRISKSLTLRMAPLGRLTPPVGYGFAQLWPHLDLQWETHQSIDQWGNDKYKGWPLIEALQGKRREALSEEITRHEDLRDKFYSLLKEHQTKLEKVKAQAQEINTIEKTQALREDRERLEEICKNHRVHHKNNLAIGKSLERQMDLEPLIKEDICQILGVASDNAYKIKERWNKGLKNQSLVRLEFLEKGVVG